MPPDEEPTISPDVTLGPERSIGGDVTAGADVALGVIDRYVLVAKLGQGGFGVWTYCHSTICRLRGGGWECRRTGLTSP